MSNFSVGWRQDLFFLSIGFNHFPISPYMVGRARIRTCAALKQWIYSPYIAVKVFFLYLTYILYHNFYKKSNRSLNRRSTFRLVFCFSAIYCFATLQLPQAFFFLQNQQPSTSYQKCHGGCGRTFLLALPITNHFFFWKCFQKNQYIQILHHPWKFAV